MTNQPAVADDDYDLFVPMPRAKQRVIDTIKDLGLKVVPADVVAKTGLPIHEATSLLNKVAAETKATMQVASSGQIIYSFVPQFESTYALRGMQKTMRVLAITVFRLGFLVLRLSFGAILLASLIVVVMLIVTCIIAAIGALLGDSGGDLGGDIGGGSFEFFDLGSIGDGFSWNYTDSHQRKIEHYGVSERSWRPKNQVKKGNFFLECFSFLFGDGDPNADLEQQRWFCVAEVIRQNDYVVTAEQLAPFTGKPASDDSGMFETLARFEGVPVVTDNGTILYVFDQMRRSSKSVQSRYVHLPPYLEERRWRFSEYPGPALFTVLIFATLNFLGSWWLFRHIATINMLQHFVVLIDVLLAYGALFLLIPFFRIIFNAVMNVGIDARNRQREALIPDLTGGEVRMKVREAADYSRALPAMEMGSIVYSTDRDALEQQFER